MQIRRQKDVEIDLLNQIVGRINLEFEGLMPVMASTMMEGATNTDELGGVVGDVAASRGAIRGTATNGGPPQVSGQERPRKC